MLFKKDDETNDIDIKIVNQIRTLGLDIVNNAGVGHEGVILSAAPILYTLFSKHLHFNPKDGKYLNRDRFILSNGHASSLLYATLYMAGYPYTEEDLRNFRKINSITPGHPEYNPELGIEMTTGPLGQGIGTSVGFAISEEYLRNYFKSKNINLIDHYTYVLVGDGDLMEGISYEAISLAGTLKLNKLIVLYDNNNVSLDGSCDLTFTENKLDRFLSCGWNVIEVNDSEDIKEIDKAISKAKESDKPTFISIKTVLGKHSKYENSNLIHGHILTSEDITEIKNKLGVRDIAFTVSNELLEQFQNDINERNLNKYEEYMKYIEELDNEYVKRFVNNDMKISLGEIIDNLEENSTIRDSSYKVLNSIDNPFFMSTSCDLFSSCKNYLYEKGNFSNKNRLGQNIYIGIREHVASAVMSGLSLNGIRSVTSTFLVFSDYMIPSIRLAAIMNLPNVYIFTHDSVSIGSDGITHQPIEQLDNLRNIPNVEVFRPADLNEIIGTYKTVFNKNEGVSIVIISKNDVKSLENTSINDTGNGAYILKHEIGKLDGVLISSGEDIHKTLELQKRFLTKGIDLRVVSMPSINRFDKQDIEYKEQILPNNVKKVVVESSLATSYLKYVNDYNNLINISTFGKSGSKEEIEKELAIDIDSLDERLDKLI